MGRKIEFDVIDIIDLCVGVLQYEHGGDLLDFLIEMIPEGQKITDADFKAYWTEYGIMMEEQRSDLEDSAISVKAKLFELGKWAD